MPLVAFGALLFKCIWPERNFGLMLITTSVWYAAFFSGLSLLPRISSYPFTLTWSEGSAYYYASLFFSERIYGINANLPLINPTRHMLLAIPFLFGNLPIWAHRLWEVILWLLISGVSIALLVRRLDIQDKFIRWIYIAWVFIYIFQGPVFYFLLISLIPILWGFDSKRFKKTLLLVLMGSVWVGASRVNWLPFPGLFAAVLYLLERGNISSELDSISLDTCSMGCSWNDHCTNSVVWICKFIGKSCGAIWNIFHLKYVVGTDYYPTRR